MRSLYIAGLLSVLCFSAAAQRTISTIGLQLSFPQGEYKATYPVTGVGVRWDILFRPSPEIPLSIGGELGFLVTGTDSRYFDLYYLGYFDRYRVTASNNIVSMAFKARADLVSPEKPVLFFVDATIGTNLFFSSVDLERETYFGNSQSAGGNSSKGYWAFSWGPGAGIEIPLGKSKEIALSLKGSWLFGTNTKYLTDPYIDNNGNIFFTERESKTDMVITEAGMRFSITGNKNRRRGRR